MPRKNISIVEGLPLIAWTIRSAVQSGLLDRIVVSTDDEEIARVARDAGAEVPFLRPPELATEEAASMDVIVHAIEELESQESYRPTCVMLLQPTSPLRRADDIRSALALYQDKNADVVVSVREEDSQPPLYVLPDGRIASPDAPQEQGGRGCRLNGAIYLADVQTLLATRSWFGRKTWALIMPGQRSIDVDTPADLVTAAERLRDEGQEIADGHI